MIYTEAQADALQSCGLINISPPEEPTIIGSSGIYNTSQTVLKRAIEESHEGSTPTREILRERFASVWKSTYYSDVESNPALESYYWRGLSRAANIAGRIYALLDRFEIVHPEKVYIFESGQHQVTGSYALLRGPKERIMVLRHHWTKPINYRPPRISDLTRLLHARSENPLLKSIGIYHASISNKEAWQETDLDEKRASGWVDKLTSDMAARPGEHCNSCLSKKCLKELKWIE